jgi:hypothetical protein
MDYPRRPSVRSKFAPIVFKFGAQIHTHESLPEFNIGPDWVFQDGCLATSCFRPVNDVNALQVTKMCGSSSNFIHRLLPTKTSSSSKLGLIGSFKMAAWPLPA